MGDQQSSSPEDEEMPPQRDALDEAMDADPDVWSSVATLGGGGKEKKKKTPKTREIVTSCPQGDNGSGSSSSFNSANWSLDTWMNNVIDDNLQAFRIQLPKGERRVGGATLEWISDEDDVLVCAILLRMRRDVDSYYLQYKEALMDHGSAKLQQQAPLVIQDPLAIEKEAKRHAWSIQIEYEAAKVTDSSACGKHDWAKVGSCLMRGLQAHWAFHDSQRTKDSYKARMIKLTRVTDARCRDSIKKVVLESGSLEKPLEVNRLGELCKKIIEDFGSPEEKLKDLEKQRQTQMKSEGMKDGEKTVEEF